MTNATGTIDPREAAHFGTMAADWWDPKGSSAMLHRLNPVRLDFIRGAIDAHWRGDDQGRTPLAGKTALDVGCGAGLLSEPLARMGARVTGVDAAPENIAAANAHAASSGLTIDYRAGELARVTRGRFDLVTCLEVVEHVADPHAFVAQLCARVADDGLLILSTPNRTALSRLAMITIGESVGGIPKGTHDWDRFIAPDELATMLGDAGFTVSERRGIAFGPVRGFHLSDDLTLNYILAATRR